MFIFLSVEQRKKQPLRYILSLLRLNPYMRYLQKQQYIPDTRDSFLVLNATLTNNRRRNQPNIIILRAICSFLSLLSSSPYLLAESYIAIYYIYAFRLIEMVNSIHYFFFNNISLIIVLIIL